MYKFFLFAFYISCSYLLFSDSRPNILIIMADDMSPKIKALGDNVALTPTLDNLVKSGKSYTNAFTTAGVCACSRSALLTGKNQISIGAMHMRTSSGPQVPYLAVPDMNIKAFPEILRKYGYFTFTNDKLDYQFSGIFPGTGPFTIWNSESEKYGWRSKKPEQPFFGIINLIVTHESGMFVDEMNSIETNAIKLLQQSTQIQYESPIEPDTVVVPPFLPDTKEVRNDIARAYNNIFILDQQVGEIIDALRSDELLKDTIVIFTSDHGDGLPRYKRELFDSGINVPLIMVVPDKYNLWNIHPNTKSERLISFLDIAPTILDIAGISKPYYMDGQSFLSKEENKYIFAARDRLDNHYGKTRAVRSKQYKLIKNFSPGIVGAQELSFRENLQSMKKMRSMLKNDQLNKVQKIWFNEIPELQLYDLKNDPNEIVNLAYQDGFQEVLAELETELDVWISKNNFHGELSEESLSEKFWPSGKQPITDKPTIVIDSNLLTIENKKDSEGASIGYSYDGNNWNIYEKPLKIKPNESIFIKAVKYGWLESEIIFIEK